MDQNKKHKKILFIGSVGSGKSTIVKHLSSIPAITCEVDSTKDIGKVSTTVGIDYGHITLNSSRKILLYGVPGQKKYSFLWNHAHQGSWGVVILVKNNDLNSIKEIDFIYKNYYTKSHRENTKYSKFKFLIIKSLCNSAVLCDSLWHSLIYFVNKCFLA